MNGVARTAPAVSLVLTDVDGTLVNKAKELTPRAVAAVQALQASGIDFAIVSGRPPRATSMLIGPLDIRTPIACFNGATFIRPDMSVVEQHLLSPDAARRVHDVILSHGMDAWVYCGKEWYVRDVGAPHVAHEQHVVRFAPVVVESLEPMFKSAAKIVGVSDDFDLVARCENDIRNALGDQASAARSQPYYLDVTHPSANKGNVVATLARLLSIPPAKIATIGDMPTDVLMFHRGGLSISMGNASPDVQKEADRVTESNEDDGFAKAIERFILPGAQ